VNAETTYWSAGAHGSPWRFWSSPDLGGCVNPRHNNRLQRTAFHAAAEPERWVTLRGGVWGLEGSCSCGSAPVGDVPGRLRGRERRERRSCLAHCRLAIRHHCRRAVGQRRAARRPTGRTAKAGWAGLASLWLGPHSDSLAQRAPFEEGAREGQAARAAGDRPGRRPPSADRLFQYADHGLGQPQRLAALRSMRSPKKAHQPDAPER
jgi:hypothetical protein